MAAAAAKSRTSFAAIWQTAPSRAAEEVFQTNCRPLGCLKQCRLRLREFDVSRDRALDSRILQNIFLQGKLSASVLGDSVGPTVGLG